MIDFNGQMRQTFDLFTIQGWRNSRQHRFGSWPRKFWYCDTIGTRICDLLGWHRLPDVAFADFASGKTVFCSRCKRPQKI